MPVRPGYSSAGVHTVVFMYVTHSSIEHSNICKQDIPCHLPCAQLRESITAIMLVLLYRIHQAVLPDDSPGAHPTTPQQLTVPSQFLNASRPSTAGERSKCRSFPGVLSRGASSVVIPLAARVLLAGPRGWGAKVRGSRFAVHGSALHSTLRADSRLGVPPGDHRRLRFRSGAGRPGRNVRDGVAGCERTTKSRGRYGSGPPVGTDEDNSPLQRSSSPRSHYSCLQHSCSVSAEALSTGALPPAVHKRGRYSQYC